MFERIALLLIFTFSAHAQTIIPFEREIARIQQYDFLASTNEDSNHFRTSYGGDAQNNLYFRGYSLINSGPNDIIPTMPDNFEYAYREFYFVTDDNAKRDTYLWITDNIGSGATSDYLESVLFFLPRISQQKVTEGEQELFANLATGEEVVFFKKYKTLLSGVLSEAPMDYNPDRRERQYAQMSYSGKGVIIRSDAKGSDPRLAKKVKVIRTGLPDCIVSGKEFWTQEGHPKFKFVNDEDAYAVILKKCGKGYLPAI